MDNSKPLPTITFTDLEGDEFRRMARRFRKLDIDGSGAISMDEFMSLPELQQNPLVRRVITLLDDDRNGEIDFKEFLRGISPFSARGDKHHKMHFAFRIYDLDGDGAISHDDLFAVLKMMVGSNLRDAQLRDIVHKTISYHDKDGNGKITYDEFCDVVEHTEVHKKMVLRKI